MQSGYDGFNSFKQKKAEEMQELNEKMEAMTRKVVFYNNILLSTAIKFDCLFRWRCTPKRDSHPSRTISSPVEPNYPRRLPKTRS